MNIESWNPSGTSSSKSTEVTALDLENSHFKLWIGTLKGLPKHSSYESAALFADRTITYVDVVGTVVDRVSLGRASIYVLDDGTGVISCHLKRNDSKPEKISDLKVLIQNDSSIMLMSKEEEDGIEKLLTLLENEENEFEIGDTIQVKGRLSFYKEEWKLFANVVHLIGFEEECYRCVELDFLYKNIYKVKNE